MEKPLVKKYVKYSLENHMKDIISNINLGITALNETSILFSR